jgi:hypothetical protein
MPSRSVADTVVSSLSLDFCCTGWEEFPSSPMLYQVITETG